MSASLILLFELEYMKRLQCCGWNSAAVITSVNSSMFTGLMSTMSIDYQHSILIVVHGRGVRLTKALITDAEIPKVDP
jgi:hypothetical protein